MKKLILKTGLALLIGAGTAGASDDNFYCDKRGLGANFYCTPPEPIPEPELPISIPQSSAPAPMSDPLESFRKFQEDIKFKREMAVWEPSRENVREYLKMQIIASNKASMFSQRFAEIGWQEPELSAVVNNPVSAIGRADYKGLEARNTNSKMAELRARYGLFYFYAGNCAACRTFSPIMKSFSDYHKFEVMAVSTDGEPNPYFDNWRKDNGTAVRMGLTQGLTPAVVLFDMETRETIPVGFGVMSQSDLEYRIINLTGNDEINYLGGDYVPYSNN